MNVRDKAVLQTEYSKSESLEEKRVSRRIEKSLQELAESLQLSESRYVEANRTYKSVADWLQRPESTLCAASPQVSLQGSFRHGTPIKPVNDEDHHDVDLVCQVSMSKESITQLDLKSALGVEMNAYSKRHGMQAPEQGNRCWTLTYADSAQFHLDCLPAIPDNNDARLGRVQNSLDQSYVESTLAITDRRHPEFERLTKRWLQSNPEGYADWFQGRMTIAFDSRREALALAESKQVDDIPQYRVRTPLQLVIQMLKRHRDIYFIHRVDVKVISVIITTLAAHAYNNETRLSAALIRIVENMKNFIETRDGIDWIGNPSHPTENFADRWALDSERRDAFYSWHDAVTTDIALLLELESQTDIDEFIRDRFGSGIAKTIAENRKPMSHLRTRLFERITPKHRRSPPWDLKIGGTVSIDKVTSTAKGFRDRRYKDGGAPLIKETGLRFHANTQIPRPFSVYWQIVNWGDEAIRRGDLRGCFDDGGISSGNLTRRETARYSGTHTIECFIVKDGYLAARSGRFEVNVR